ncbi:MAG: LPS export ABC transporter ATP-binding protein [Parvibaculales bacterium]
MSENSQSDENGLRAVNLSKTYSGRQVVKNVSLQLNRHQAIGLLGPNGAGKTTTFYMMTGLVRPDSGQIFIDGHNVSDLPMYRRARLGLGYLPQEASVFRGLNVAQNIMAILQAVEPDANLREEKLNNLLEDFSIGHLRHVAARTLSGGERRRVEIARALASNPSFILLDEPFAGVDPIAIGDIHHLISQLTQRGIGVLITDHNVREALGVIDHAIIIHDGQILMEGSTNEIINDEQVRALYLGDGFSLI